MEENKCKTSWVVALLTIVSIALIMVIVKKDHWDKSIAAGLSLAHCTRVIYDYSNKLPITIGYTGPIEYEGNFKLRLGQLFIALAFGILGVYLMFN